MADVETFDGLKISQTATMLIKESERWLAVFPGFEVPGELNYLINLLSDVYENRRRYGDSMENAFRRAVPDYEQYRWKNMGEDL